MPTTPTLVYMYLCLSSSDLSMIVNSVLSGKTSQLKPKRNTQTQHDTNKDNCYICHLRQKLLNAYTTNIMRNGFYSFGILIPDLREF